MDLLLSIATEADRLDPAIAALLDHFRDGRVPLHLSVAIVATAAALLAVLVAWGLPSAWALHPSR